MSNFQFNHHFFSFWPCIDYNANKSEKIFNCSDRNIAKFSIECFKTKFP